MDLEALIMLALAFPAGVVILFIWVAVLARRTRALEREVAALRMAAVRPEMPVLPGASVESAVPAAAVPPRSDMPVADAPLADAPLADATGPLAAVAGEDAAAPRLFDPWAPKGAALVGPEATLSPPGPPPLPVPTGPSGFERFGAWLRENWVYAISGVSLALAGVFFVQYGIERGLLPPVMRVLMGIGFGLALVGTGEYVRRRFGDRLVDSTAYLPSVFSGAGVVSVFAAVVAARQMYGLIGPEAGFAALVLTAAGAVVLGWFNGPFMVALGLAGAATAPFVVGGSAEAVDWLYAYFALVAAVGLMVDTVRRWAWVSVLALGLGFVAGLLLRQGGGGADGWMLLCFALVPLAVGLPALRLMPDHAGPTMLAAVLQPKGDAPIFPVKLAAGAVAASTLLLTVETGGMLPFALLAALALVLALWSEEAPGLQDMALLPAAGFLLRLGSEGLFGGALSAGFLQGLYREPETAAPMTVTWLVLMAAAMSGALAWRSLRGPLHPLVLSGAAALAAPVAVLVIELLWSASLVMGSYPWALHVVALAAMMTALALAFARLGDLRRAAHFTLSALSLIALAMFLTLTAAALTVALAVLVVVAAGLDQRFRLPEMGWFLQAAVMVIGWRVTVDPGIVGSIDASWGAMVLGHVAPLAAFATAIWLLRGLPRDVARAFLESGFAGTAAVFADVVIFRVMDSYSQTLPFDTHWGMALLAYPWLVLTLVQLYRAALGGWLRWLRYAIAAVAGVAFTAMTLIVLVADSPLTAGERVIGPLLLDSMLLAYVLPGVTLIFGQRFLGHLPRGLRRAMLGGGVALCALYAALEIRRFWRGDDLSVAGTTQPELYSYTVALLVLGAVLLWQAIAKASPLLRRMAMGVIAVTVAKVFLVDASGLSGLIRVFSFLALGLALAGLAWLNRWAAGRMAGADQAGTGAP
ncbi:DUF2339 domain-containing protein [Paragemmobacter straminiformis]|uniref:DUF2339 domain-containing protein n=1 Tax=Paragemmobacter straminiformis TaxID=2045119 RepID=A0A842ID34_9RHOB|nr:DUF2339 domain-containing protein [Gemmobacter straminiformis]MBC2837207.1 DUF2339 domain-containing protein [Gemmobacter straminiformis]